LLLAGISGKHPIYKTGREVEIVCIINERPKKLRDLECIILEIEKNRIQMEAMMAKAKILAAASEFIIEEQIELNLRRK